MEINEGDCLEELKKLESESIDAVVTDPPAGISFMGKEWDNFADIKTIKSQVVTWMRSGVKFDNSTRNAFMGFMQEVMSECLRVLKPGAHAVVWALPRTSHWTTMAVEDAGFEIRDVIHHIFNTGFPKSLNIGKSVDKLQGNEREMIGISKYGVGNTPTSIHYEDGFATSRKKEFDITKGNSPHEGFGTALKPACEHWILARKPLSEKTVAENVLRWGTGGLDIDGCRIPISGEKVSVHNAPVGTFAGGEQGRGSDTSEYRENNLGRFPANVIVQNDVLNDGVMTKSGKMNQRIEGGEFNVWGKQYPRDVETIGDSGSKSRYFDIDLWAKKQGILQIPKPSKSEKNRGLEGFGKRYMDMNRVIGSVGGSNPRNRGAEKPRANSHPTVKSITLMSWFIKLISKEGDIVLDPFAGSFTTGVACVYLKRNFIGIEKEKEYVEIGRARVKYAEQELKNKEKQQVLI